MRCLGIEDTKGNSRTMPRTYHRISCDKEQELEFKSGEKEIGPKGNRRPVNSKSVEFKLGEIEAS